MSLYLHCGRLSACATVEGRILKTFANRDVAQFACPVKRTGPFYSSVSSFSKKRNKKTTLFVLSRKGRYVHIFLLFTFNFNFSLFLLQTFFNCCNTFAVKGPLQLNRSLQKIMFVLLTFVIRYIRYSIYPVPDSPEYLPLLYLSFNLLHVNFGYDKNNV